MLFPPFCDICVIGFTGTDEKKTAASAELFMNCLKLALQNHPEKLPLRILRPMPFIYGKINNKYRYRIIIKCKNTKQFREFIRDALKLASKAKETSGIHIYVDMNGSTSL